METEQHIFVLWEKATNTEKIIEHLRASPLTFIQAKEINWKNFPETLSRFYQEDITKLPKLHHTGCGAFTAILVQDRSPHYSYQNTSRGPRIVNTNMFLAKQLYRSWSGDPDTVHASDDPKEAIANIAMLDEPGLNGWDNLTDVLSILDKHTRYVVLRNFENLPHEAGDDLDILVEDPAAAFWGLNAKMVHDDPRRVQVHIKLKGEEFPVDIRFVGDCYVDPEWARDIIARRQGRKPEYDDWYYGLLYHAFIHKGILKNEYREQLGVGNDDEQLRSKLRAWLTKKGYRITEPIDPTVPALPL